MSTWTAIDDYSKSSSSLGHRSPLSRPHSSSSSVKKTSSRCINSCKRSRSTSTPSPLQPTSTELACADDLYKLPTKRHRPPLSRRQSSLSSFGHRSPSESSRCTNSCKRSRRTSTSPLQPTSTKLPYADYLYKPSAKRCLAQTSITSDLSTIEHQHTAWKNFKKIIICKLNKVNKSNVLLIISELLQYNIVRGKVLFARSIIEAQIASPFYTPVYAALLSVVNSMFPQIGKLVVTGLLSSFHHSYQRNDKSHCLTTIKFIAHLINQNVLIDMFGFEMVAFLLRNSSDNSVELAIEFIKECGQKLSQVYSCILDLFFSKLRNLLHESSLDKRTLKMIEVLFDIRIDEFKAKPSILPGLDLVHEDDQYIHIIELENPGESEPMLDVFQYDAQYQENEEKYEQTQRTTLNETGDNEDDSSSSSSNSDEEEEKRDDRVENEYQQSIIDQTDTNLLIFLRTIYLTNHINNSAAKCARKLLLMSLPGQEVDICEVILDNCVDRRRYKPFLGLLGHHLCSLKTEYVKYFEKAFQDRYNLVHHLEDVKLKNISKFFAYMLATNSISWSVIRCIRLTEEDTTSSSLIYIKYLFLGLVKSLGGCTKLNNRLIDPTVAEYFQGIFLRDNPKNTTFSIRFFASIGLDQLTNELKEFLRRNSTSTPPVVAARFIKEKEEENHHQNQGDIEALHREVQIQ